MTMTVSGGVNSQALGGGGIIVEVCEPNHKFLPTTMSRSEFAKAFPFLVDVPDLVENFEEAAK